MPRGRGRGPSPAEIADAIEAEIRSGARAPDSRLRSRSAMAVEYGVGQSTIFSAIEKLKDRGLVYGKQGSRAADGGGGVFVAAEASWRVIPPPAPSPDA